MYKTRCGKREFQKIAQLGGHSAQCKECKRLKQIELDAKEKNCLICGNLLTDLQKKYCSQICCATAGGQAMKGYKYSDKRREEVYGDLMDYRKNKTWEEIFGKDKSDKMKRGLITSLKKIKRSDEFKIKVSKAMTGRKITWGDKISDATMGRIVKPEWERKRLESRMGMSYEEWIETKSKYEKYRSKVYSITKKQPLHLLENINKRALAGLTGAYHLDHIVSIKDGFVNNISAEKIGHISNLRMIPWRKNLEKGAKSETSKVSEMRTSA